MKNMVLLRNAGENFDLNFVTKKFPADKIFTILQFCKYIYINGTLNKEETKISKSISAVEDDIEPQFTSFSDEAWFRLQGYINATNNSLIDFTGS
jgi:hypothetical protein